MHSFNFNSWKITYLKGVYIMKKMDEMEFSISLKATKWAWAYTFIFLAIWAIYEFVKTHTFGLPFFLLTTQNLILLFVQYFLKWKLGKDEK